MRWRDRRAPSLRTLLGVSLAALCAARPVIALPTDSQQPIHIQADRAELDQNTGIATYYDHVVVDQGSMHVTADKLTIEVQNNQVVKITAEGRQAHYRQLVNEQDPEVLADADTIIYHTQDGKIDLIGNGHLTQTPNEFSGELIHYDIDAGKVDAKSPQSGKVNAIFKPTPQQQQQQKSGTSKPKEPQQQQQSGTPKPQSPQQSAPTPSGGDS